MTKKPTLANGNQARGKPFRKGKSGNPKGRPKGARTKPVELTVDQEIEALQQRAIDLVVEGQEDAAVNAFEKSFVLAWGVRGNAARPGEARERAREMVAMIAKEVRIEALRGWYDDRDPEFLEHVGLPADVTWDEYRAHYTAGLDDIDMERAANDLMTYPPIVTRLAELTAERAAQEQRA